VTGWLDKKQLSFVPLVVAPVPLLPAFGQVPLDQEDQAVLVTPPEGLQTAVAAPPVVDNKGSTHSRRLFGGEMGRRMRLVTQVLSGWS
jgi:hypothetical protein